jgi:lipopolysaccharide transport system ATP-binding protein
VSNEVVIRVENLSKQYRYGVLSHRALYKDVQSWWARFRGQEDPNVRVGKFTHHPSPSTDDADHFWALRDINFEVKQGEVLGIIGKNGAGKSTLLKIMSRVTTPTKGQIKIKGRVASLLEVGTGFHPELTGRENIFLNGAILGMTKAEIKKKFDEIVAFAEVEKFIDTPVKRYSSGMYVRLAFAVAAHLEPEILIIDEVLAVGDAQFQKKCLGKMGDVAKEGRTVLFVSHNMTAVQNLCCRGIVLEGGNIIFDATGQEAVNQYLSGLQSKGEQTRAGIYDLTGRHNEFQENEILIRKIILMDSTGHPVNKLQMGSDLIIVMELEGLKGYPDAQVGIAFRSLMDQFVAHFTTAMRPARFRGQRTEFELAIARIPRLPFNRGPYWIDVAVAIDGVRIFDYVERAVDFEIVEADVYGTGYRIKPEQGTVFLDGLWEIIGLENAHENDEQIARLIMPEAR